MSEETNQVTSEPAGEAGPLTESAAAALLQDWSEGEEERKAPPVDTARVRANEAEEAAEAAEADDDGASPDDETAPEGDDEGTAEADEAAEEYVHGNAKTRLRDGTEISVGDLKKLADEAREFKRRESEFTAKQREIEMKAARTAQQEQLFSQTIQQAIGALQQTLPPEPDPKLRATDPIEYFLQKDQRDAKLAEINRLQAAQNYAAQEAQARQAVEFQAYLKTQQEQLYDRVADLRDETKRRSFYSDLLSAGKHYGFSDEEVNGIHDHRVMLMARDAIAYRKLQSEKPKVKAKTVGAKPVAKPAARVAAPTRVAAEHKGLFNRFAKTRSIDDAGALLANLE